MKLYHVTTVDSAKKIMKDGACSKKSEQQSGGFYLWTSLERAKKYTSDDYILNKGDDICILVFDLEFNTNDFDLDYEISGPWIRKWADENLKKITEEAEKLGYKLMSPASEGLNHYWRRDEPFHAVIMPDPSPGSFSGKSERFLKFLSQLGLLDELEIWAVNYKKHAPAVKYMKTERIFPNEILDKDGEKLNLSLNESILIAESQLRRIIREELIKETSDSQQSAKFRISFGYYYIDIVGSSVHALTNDAKNKLLAIKNKSSFPWAISKEILEVSLLNDVKLEGRPEKTLISFVCDLLRKWGFPKDSIDRMEDRAIKQRFIHKEDPFLSALYASGEDPIHFASNYNYEQRRREERGKHWPD